MLIDLNVSLKDYIERGYSLPLNSGKVVLLITLILANENSTASLALDQTNIAIIMVGEKILY